MLRMLLSLSFFFFLGLSAKSQSAPGWENTLDEGYAKMEQKDFEGALVLSENWLSENTDPKPARAAFLTLNGNALRNLGQLEKALENHLTAAQIRAEIFGPSSLELANCFQNIGNCFWDWADFENALIYFEKNLQIRQKNYPSDDQRLVLPLLNFGDALFETGQIEKAQALFHEALEIEQKNGEGVSLNAAILRSDLANCFLQNGQYLRALDSLRQALFIFQKYPSEKPLEMGRCHQRIGHCHLEMGDAESARQHYESALILFETSPPDLAPMNLEMARLLRFEGEYDRALEHLSVVASAVETLSKKSKVRPRFLSGAWIQFGSCFLEMGEIDGANFYFEKAEKEAEVLSDKTTFLSAVFLKKGTLAEKKNDFGEAKKQYESALLLAEKSNDRSMEFGALRRLGLLKLRAGETSSALDFFLMAQKILGSESGFEYEKIQAQKSIAEVLLNTARKTKKKKDWRAVVEAASEGIRLLSELKGGFRNEQSELDVQSDFFHLYNYAIRACAHAGAPADALHFTEDYRSSLARKLTRRTGAEMMGTSSISGRLSRVEEGLAAAKKKRFELGGGGSFALRPEALAEVDGQVQSLSDQRDILLDSLALSDPSSFSFWHQKQMPTPQEIQKSLAAGQTFLEYHWGGSELFVFVFRKDTFLLETLPLSKKLRGDIFTFFKACNQNPAWLPNGSPAELPQLGHQLYGQIIAPVSEWLGEEIIISPDAWLWYLPFEALLTQPAKDEEAYWNFPYLIKEKTVSYVQSALLFEQLKNVPRSNFAEGLLTMAPVFKKGDSDFKPLLHNVEEASMASEIISGKCFTEAEASEANLRQWAPHFQMILLSTHGVLDDRNAAWSHLVLASPNEDREHELLHAWEIGHLRLPAELVMLSACQTANGRMNRGEGLMSLVRAFHFSGTKTVVGSLWNVDDRQTPLLIESFLKRIEKGEAKNTALAEAKREYLTSANRLKTHPFFWAGFVFSGDVSAVEIVDEKMSWWGWAVGVLSLGLVGFWFMKRKD